MYDFLTALLVFAFLSLSLSSSAVEWLTELGESLAWVDLTLTYADVISRSSHPWVRPEFTQTGETRIINGRHPLMQETRQDAFVPVSPGRDEEGLSGPYCVGCETATLILDVIRLSFFLRSFVVGRRTMSCSRPTSTCVSSPA